MEKNFKSLQIVNKKFVERKSRYLIATPRMHTLNITIYGLLCFQITTVFVTHRVRADFFFIND